MPLPALVLVHGGVHAADCWDLTIAELRRQEPQLETFAVDLPGRRGKPGDLSTATIGQWVESVVDDVERAGFEDIVIVGHSLAGVTLPGVVARLGASRVREMILAAAFIPVQGAAIVDVIAGPLAGLARRRAQTDKPLRLPALIARYAFCNGMTRAQRLFAVSHMYEESLRVAIEPVDRSDLPPEVPRTWILTLRDRALPVSAQRTCMTALGGVQNVIPIDACHNVMVSHPKQLATILIERCRSAAPRATGA
jgi:pimeloyl-ACP methyl ester carboxylesterase